MSSGDSKNLTTLQQDAAGRVQISESVVSNIAGLAAREVEGVFDLGKGRLAKTFRGSSPARGVDVEVGSTEVAIDLELVVAFGHNIPDVCGSVRHKVTERVAQMTGLKVKELNINVVDIHFPEESKEKPEPRVK